MYNASAPGTTPRPRPMMSSRLRRAAAPTARSSDVAASSRTSPTPGKSPSGLQVVREVHAFLERGHPGGADGVQADRRRHLGVQPQLRELRGGDRSVQDLLGPARFHGAHGDAVARGRRKRLLVRQLAAVVVQQARELGLLRRGAEPLRQDHGFGRHTVRVVTPARRQPRGDERLRRSPGRCASPVQPCFVDVLLHAARHQIADRPSLGGALAHRRTTRCPAAVRRAPDPVRRPSEPRRRRSPPARRPAAAPPPASRARAVPQAHATTRAAAASPTP